MHLAQIFEKLRAMSNLEILLLALALSIDAFAVSLSVAATGRIQDGRATFRLSFHFGLFQFMMPVLGWTAGLSLAPFVVPFDHWIAFVLLLYVAARMIRASFVSTHAEISGDPSRGLTLMALAVVTSIDALAAGLSLAILGTDIWWPSLVIGMVTGAVSLLAIRLGRRLNTIIGKRADLVGGLLLVFLAFHVLLSHVP